MPYVLFVSGRKNPTLHRTDCFHYVSRKTPDKTANVQWTPPHRNIEDAILKAIDLRKDELLILCKDCTTPEDKSNMLRILASRPHR